MIFDFETPGQRIIIARTVSGTGKSNLTALQIEEIIATGKPYRDEYLSIDYDTIVHQYGGRGMDTLILKYQYFSTMKVMDPKTGKAGKYSMKGASWFDYFFWKKK
jgi:hypothetical protein